MELDPHIQPPVPQEVAQAGSPAAEPVLGRRRFLGLLTAAVSGPVVIGLAYPDSAQAEVPTHSASQPSTSPTAPSSPSLEDQKTQAEIRNLDADTANKQSQLETDKLNREKTRTDLRYDLYTRLAAGGVAVGGLVTGVIGLLAFFSGRKDKLDLERSRLAQEQAELRRSEDASYQNALNSIQDAQNGLSTTIMGPGSHGLDYNAASLLRYTGLISAYHQLGEFVENPRFAGRVFEYAKALFADRAKKQIREGLSAEQRQVQDLLREKELSADRILFDYMCRALPHVPRTDNQGRRVLLNGRGMSFVGFRSLSPAFDGLDLTGAYFNDSSAENLVLTGKIVDSVCVATKFRNVTVGTEDEPCDLSGTDMSKAEFGPDTHFRHIIVNGNTQLSEAVRQNPSTIFDEKTVVVFRAPNDEIRQMVERARADIANSTPEASATGSQPTE